MKIASRLSNVTYAIRDVVIWGKEVEATGRKVLKLNIGDPNIYDLDTPQFLKDALTEAVKAGKNGYADSHGDAGLLSAVAKYDNARGVDTKSTDVVACSGVSESLALLFGAIVETGVEALFPSPCYPQYPALMSLYGGKSVFFNTPQEQGFDPDVDDFRKKITGKTAFALLNNPSNPTGTVYSTKRMKELLDVCAEHKLLVIADEIYDELVFEGRFQRAAAINKDVPIVSLNGISKNFVAPGWRLGWMVFNNFKDDTLKKAVLQLCRLRLSASYPVQVAASNCLSHPQFPAFNKKVVDTLRKRRDLTFKRLNEIDGISCVKPAGAFYAFPSIDAGPWKSDKEFVRQLLDQQAVLTVFGEGFYSAGRHFRVVFLAPEATLNDAFDKIEAFVKAHAK